MTWLGRTDLPQRAARVFATFEGRVATSVALGCAGTGLWRLFLALSMQARRTAWEWAVWLNNAFVVATHLDADPIMLDFGFVIEQLLVGTGVGLVAHFVLGRLPTQWKERALQPFVLSAMVAAAPWLLNGVAVASVFASGISTTEMLLVLVLGTCILGTLAAFGLALAQRRRTASLAALAFGSLIAGTIFWLRSPLPWILQVLCAAALATLFIQACRPALPVSQEAAPGGARVQ